MLDLKRFFIMTTMVAMAAIITGCAGGHQMYTVDRYPVSVDEFLTHIDELAEDFILEADEDDFNAGHQITRVTRLKNELNENLSGVDNLATMGNQERTELYNLSEEFYAAVFPEREATRTICRSEKPTGSHIPQTRCYTVKDRRDEREITQRAVFDLQQRSTESGSN